ncbi:MAG TPA: DUF6622 family protein [Burkholderiaceae bacterium]|nr:DUF6622 family protein [Burkholderiaceae bacterium]
MQTSPTPSMVIVEILRHTPPGVWIALSAITVLGVLQLRTHRASRTRLLVAPIVLALYSLWATCSAFGVAAAPAWLAGSAIVLLASRALRVRRPVALAADGRFVLPGSAAPLLLMWSLFGLRYAVAVTLVFHPAWAHSAAMVVGVAALYGALSGVFAARAWGVLQSSGWPATTQAA